MSEIDHIVGEYALGWDAANLKARLRKLILDEREACARIADAFEASPRKYIAEAIRGRGKP